jgi:hypothetical protein
VKVIDDISKSEGNLLYIWVIFHHRWLIHKTITNNHIYINKTKYQKHIDYPSNHWFNKPIYIGFRRDFYIFYKIAKDKKLSEVIKLMLEKPLKDDEYIEYFLANGNEIEYTEAIRGCLINLYLWKNNIGVYNV